MGQGHTKCCPVPSKSYDLCTCKIWNCYVQQFRRRCIYKKVHYLTLTWRSRSNNVLSCKCIFAQCPLHHVTYAPTEFEVTTSKALGGEAFTRNSIFDLDLGVKVTQNVAQYPLHHVNHPATKFEVARSNRLGGDTFTRKFNIWPLTLTLGSRSHKMLPSTLYIMWPFQLQKLKLLVKRLRRRCIYKIIQYLTFDLDLGVLTLTLGSRSHKMLPSTLYIMWPIQLQSLKLLRLTV